MASHKLFIVWATQLPIFSLGASKYWFIWLPLPFVPVIILHIDLLVFIWLSSSFFSSQMITKATADGTLYTKDWDVEPLFPLPSADAVNTEYILPISLSLSWCFLNWCIQPYLMFYLMKFCPLLFGLPTKHLLYEIVTVFTFLYDIISSLHGSYINFNSHEESDRTCIYWIYRITEIRGT